MAQKILNTADALMVQRGYSAFSYADISEAVGIRKASIHHHFPTKAGLAAAVLKAQRDRVLKGTGALDAEVESPLDRLRAYIDHWESCIRGKSVSFCVAALLGAEMPALPKEVQVEVRLHLKALVRWFEKTLKDGVKQRSIRLQNSAAIEARTLMAVVHGGMLSARALNDCDLFRKVTEASIKRIEAVRE